MTRRTYNIHSAFDPPSHPPRSWFDRPDFLEDDERFVVLDNGRVGFRLYDSGMPLEHPDPASSAGWVPSSPTGFAAFHQGQLVCSDGSAVAVGAIGLGHGGKGDTYRASLHYDSPGVRRAAVRVGEDERGVWGAGVAVRGLTQAQVAEMRALSLSGHWEPMSDAWWQRHRVASAGGPVNARDLVGIGLVTFSGQPLPRRRAASVAVSTSQANPAFVAPLLAVDLQPAAPEYERQFAEQILAILDGATLEPEIDQALAKLLQQNMASLTAGSRAAAIEPMAPALDIQDPGGRVESIVDQLEDVITMLLAPQLDDPIAEPLSESAQRVVKRSWLRGLGAPTLGQQAAAQCTCSTS